MENLYFSPIYQNTLLDKFLFVKNGRNSLERSDF